jgi:hypothetical protein
MGEDAGVLHGVIAGRRDARGEAAKERKWIHVGQLVEHVVGVAELNDAGRFGGPQVFAPAEERVHRGRDEAMQDLEKLGQAAPGIGDDAVPVVGHHDEPVHLDARMRFVSGLGSRRNCRWLHRRVTR